MTIKSSFRLPQDAVTYTDSVVERCRALISYGIWSGIPAARLDAWIENFEGADGHYFAARVLDSLIYRSEDQTNELLKQLYQRILPDYARLMRMDPSIGSALSELQSGDGDPAIRLIAVEPPKAAPVKSGPTIGRQIKRFLRFKDQWFCNLQDASAQVAAGKVIIFIDDFLGTGKQFSDFACNHNLERFFSTGSCIYAPIAAHTRGIQELKRRWPSLHVITCDILDNGHGIFNKESWRVDQHGNTAEEAANYYQGVIKERSLKISPALRFGYGKLGLAYAFSHSTPNNSIPLLWWEHQGWSPLVMR